MKWSFTSCATVPADASGRESSANGSSLASGVIPRLAVGLDCQFGGPSWRKPTLNFLSGGGRLGLRGFEINQHPLAVDPPAVPRFESPFSEVSVSYLAVLPSSRASSA
jgi:hypothetical protein